MEQVEIVDAATAIKAGGGAFHLAERDYHADPCPEPSQSSSITKVLINETPAHAYQQHPRLNPDYRPKAGTKVMDTGSVCHALMAGDVESIVEIHHDDYRKKEAKEAKASAVADGNTPILSRQLDKARTIVEAAYNQLVGSGSTLFGAGDSEVTIAHDNPAYGWQRIKIDWWSEDRLILADYKTSEGSASEAAFAKRAAQMDYDIQDAFYISVVEEVFPFLAGRLRFVFVVQEMDPPYLLAVRELAESDRTVARRKVAIARRIWRDCLDSGKWPGYASGIERFVMPGWHQNAWLEREAEDEDA